MLFEVNPTKVERENEKRGRLSIRPQAKTQMRGGGKNNARTSIGLWSCIEFVLTVKKKSRPRRYARELVPGRRLRWILFR
jgi:hypothetical protein